MTNLSLVDFPFYACPVCSRMGLSRLVMVEGPEVNLPGSGVTYLYCLQGHSWELHRTYYETTHLVLHNKPTPEFNSKELELISELLAETTSE